MLYFKALLAWHGRMPAADPAVRAVLEREGASVAGRRCTRSWPGRPGNCAAPGPGGQPAHPARAGGLARLRPPISSFQQTGRSGAPRQRLAALPLLSLEPVVAPGCTSASRSASTHAGAGLLDEVRALRGRGDLHAELPSMRCVGYRQAWQALDGTIAPEALRERGIAATRQLAKRQLTWLRSMPQRQVVACDAPDAVGQAVARALALCAPGAPA
jgi:tRNA dimethylallyltransferase